jgi:hypothetical protein
MSSLLGQRRYDLSQKYSSEALELLNDMRKMDQLCDAELVLVDGSLKVRGQDPILGPSKPQFPCSRFGQILRNLISQTKRGIFC